jgi:predicted double-glycine peptidase
MAAFTSERGTFVQIIHVRFVPIADMIRTRSNVVAELMKGTARWNTWRRAFNFGCGASGR